MTKFIKKLIKERLKANAFLKELEITSNRKKAFPYLKSRRKVK